MIILYMAMSVVCAFALVFLLEFGWTNRPPAMAVQWPKSRAMRFMWAAAGILVVMGQIPLGIMSAIAGLPVCLAHLRLGDRQPATQIGVAAVADHLYHTARSFVRNFMDRTQIGPHR